MLFSASLLLSFIAAAQAGCDNACSGHGTCQLDGVCDCYDNWGLGLSHDSGDCSDRICPFEIAWVDKPDVNGQRHKYAECAGRGLCNRDSGLCECFPGYEGKACQRTTCPNDCSGHGQCAYMDDLPYQTTPHDWFNNMNVGSDINTNNADWSRLVEDTTFLDQAPKTFSGSYYGWDSMKTRGCVCDPEWGDVDCSKRMCEYGNDIMDHRPDMTDNQLYHTQQIQFKLNSAPSAQDGNTFALTFKSKLNETFTTMPIVYNYHTGTTGMTSDWSELNLDIQAALEALPNKVIDSVNVNTESRVYIDENTAPIACTGTDCVAGEMITIQIEFDGDNVQGAQNLLTVRAYECLDGCTPKLTGLELEPGTLSVSTVHLNNTNTYMEEIADYNSYECGRRGKCNYDTGLCQCFSGYTGLACNTITALV